MAEKGTSTGMEYYSTGTVLVVDCRYYWHYDTSTSRFSLITSAVARSAWAPADRAAGGTENWAIRLKCNGISYQYRSNSLFILF